MAPTFRDRLAALGLSQRAFARLIAELAGSDRPKYRTVEDWGARAEPPDTALALIGLLERIRDGTPRLGDARPGKAPPGATPAE